MARNLRVEIVSDLSGKVLEEGESETVTLALNGKAYELDLTKDEAEDLRSKVEEYFKVGRKVAAGGRSSGRSSVSGSRAGSGKERMQEIRKWAADNGYQVNSRGRIASNIVEAFEAAQS